MAIGMTYEQYWYGDPLMVRAFYKAEQLRQQRVNDEAWLKGAYVYRAMQAALSVSEFFRGKGQRPDEYPKKPIALNAAEETEVDKEQREEQEAVYAKAYMMNMVMAGKNWHK